MRRLLVVAFAGLLLSLTWLRGEPVAGASRAKLWASLLRLEPDCCAAGPFRLVSAWHLTSGHPAFGGYSALLPVNSSRLLTFSDRGYWLAFDTPDQTSVPPQFGSVYPDGAGKKESRDIEAGAWDPVTRRLWLAQEGRNAVARYGPEMQLEALRRIPEWQDWPSNSGAESMVRLPDGRFIVLCECRNAWFGEYRHPAYLYPGDPTRAVAGRAFTFAGVDGYRPTDMAQLPDGRVLILMRRMVWPIPARFAIKVVIADPDMIVPGQVWQGREIADLAAPWPADNYEGIAIEREANGQLVAWIISDENGAVTQRVLLLKVLIDEARLPHKQKAPG